MFHLLRQTFQARVKKTPDWGGRVSQGGAPLQDYWGCPTVGLGQRLPVEPARGRAGAGRGDCPGAVAEASVAEAVQQFAGERGCPLIRMVGERVRVLCLEGRAVEVAGGVAVHGVAAVATWCSVFVGAQEPLALLLVFPSVATFGGGWFTHRVRQVVRMGFRVVRRGRRGRGRVRG